MNVTTKNSVLSQELKLLSRVSATKNTIPVLNYVLLEATDGTIRLSATDLEIGLRTTCPATTHEPGTTTLPTKKLLELLEQLPDTEITLALEGQQVLIAVGTFNSRIQTFPSRDFPNLPDRSGDEATVSASSLRLLVERARYAITEKAQKYVLDGALLSLNKTVMALVATDGKRFSLATAVRPESTDLSVLIPSKTLDLLPALCEAGGDVLISQSERHIFFVAGQRILISRMLEGQFPKYDRIIPRNCDKNVGVDRAAVTTALRRVNVVADDQQSVFFGVEPGSFILSSRCAGIGDAVEAVPIEYAGESIKVCANGKHVLDFLERASERTVTFGFKTAETPILLTDGSDYLNVVLARKP